MKNKLENIINQKYYLLFFLLYLTVLLGLYLDEDNLGGAMHDATYHFKISVNKFTRLTFSGYLLSSYK